MTECSSCRYNKLIGSMCGCDGVYSERCYQPAKPKPTNADRIQVCLPRGKRLDNGERVEGHFVSTNTSADICYADQYNDDLFLSPENILIEVDPATVGQYTGLTDKHGRKIFEGILLLPAQ